MSVRLKIRMIKTLVEKILDELNVSSVPVKIEDIAKKRGLRIKPYSFDDDVSGILVIENGMGIIGYNQFESRVRRRFTIAHELGHYELHKDLSSVFMDKQFSAHFRSQYSASNEESQRLEQEANAFAAAILMPEHLLRRELMRTKFDLGSEDGVKNLARLFDVSSTAMYYRIVNLGIIAP